MKITEVITELVVLNIIKFELELEPAGLPSDYPGLTKFCLQNTCHPYPAVANIFMQHFE